MQEINMRQFRKTKPAGCLFLAFNLLVGLFDDKNTFKLNKCCQEVLNKFGPNQAFGHGIGQG